MECRVRFRQSGEETVARARRGERLLDALNRAGAGLFAPCGGHGKCGKCLVQILAGEAGAPGPEERKFLPGPGYRLACIMRVEGDLAIRIPARSGEKILTETRAGARAGDAGAERLSLAVDLGTTTVAAYLCDEAGGVIDCAAAMNPQAAFGADVISRVDYAIGQEEGLLALKARAAGCARGLAMELIDRRGIDPARVGRFLFVGNPVMMHLLAGIDPRSIAVAPYEPAFHAPLTLDAAALLGAPFRGKVTVGGCVAGYVGADTVAAVLASGMDREAGLSLLIDIGTNGEIALGGREKLLCCACAAGPAFEGAQIRCGSAAVNGAIDHLCLTESGLRASVIGGGEAKSLCGSGLVDAVACLYEASVIDETGRMDPAACPAAYAGGFAGADAYRLSGEVVITQKDLREVQLAKAAIAAGIQILLKEAGADFGAVKNLYLAGGFGNYIDAASACKIGLLPPELEGVIRPVGNAAGAGAIMQLDKKNAARAEELRERMRYVELSARPDFQELFADAMFFPESPL